MISRDSCGCFFASLGGDDYLKVFSCEDGPDMEVIKNLKAGETTGFRVATDEEIEKVVRSHARVKQAADEYGELKRVAAQFFRATT